MVRVIERVVNATVRLLSQFAHMGRPRRIKGKAIMKVISGVLTGVALVIAVTGTTYAQSASAQSSMDPAMMQMMQDMMPSPSDAPSTKAFKEAHMKMMKDMHVKFSGNADIDFVRGMIPHHQGAIDMAKVELAQGKDPELRTMAEKIISDQQKEMGQMEAWLKKNEK